MACTPQPAAPAGDALIAFYASRPAHRAVDHSRLSKDLSGLLSEALEAEDRDRARIKASEHPDDKPMLIEGDIFTSLYEGQDRALIEQIVVDGERAIAKVRFENTAYQIAWSDQVVLVYEGGWKIDNVIYGRDGAAEPDLRSALAAFTAAVNP
jgi:hypothetical protein